MRCFIRYREYIGRSNRSGFEEEGLTTEDTENTEQRKKMCEMDEVIFTKCGRVLFLNLCVLCPLRGE